MKNAGIVLIVFVIIATLALVLVSFQVRQTESALVTRFNKPIREITEPGWYFKWPRPIDRVHKFDSRMRVFEADLGETTTRGAVPIIVNTYVVWRIADPLTFFKSVRTVAAAESKLIGQIRDTQTRVIGRHTFAEFVNSDPAKIRFRNIEQEMQDDLGKSAREIYGITIEALGIKRLMVSEDVSKKVFERMTAERTRRTEATIARGKAEAARIRFDADYKTRELLAAAEARAKAIRAEGDAEAARFYKMLEQDPELAMFLRDTEVLTEILRHRSTIVIPADAEPFSLLKTIPDLKVADPNTN